MVGFGNFKDTVPFEKRTFKDNKKREKQDFTFDDFIKRDNTTGDRKIKQLLTYIFRFYNSVFKYTALNRHFKYYKN